MRTSSDDGSSDGAGHGTDDSGWLLRPGRGLVVVALVVGLVAIGGPTVAATVGDAMSTATEPLFAGPDDGEADIYEDGNASIAPDHVDAVFEAGSVNTTLELERDSGTRTVGVRRTTDLNVSERRLREDNRVEVSIWNGAVSSEPLRIRQFETAGGTHTRTSSSLVDGNYTVYDEDAGWNGTDPDAHLYAPILEGAEQLPWERQGSVEYDGVDGVRYTVEDPESIEDMRLNLSVTANGTGDSRSVSMTLSNVTVTDFEGTLVVDTSGVVRHLAYEVEVTEDGEPVTYVATLSFTGVGTTTVDTPDWVDPDE